MLKPYSKGINYLEEGNRVSFELTDEAQLVLACDDMLSCLYIFNSKPIECHKPENVTYFFGPGVHKVGRIVLKDNESVITDFKGVMDVVTGELSDFYGKHTFRKFESLVVIDDRKGRSAVQVFKKLTPIDLSGEWEVKECSENILTLDYCDYYFDGKLEEEKGYILNAMYRALDKGRAMNVRCDFKFNAEYIPEKLYLVCETPAIFDITLNGKTVNKDFCGYFLDKSFAKLDISKLVVLGENVISVTVDFKQSEEVNENVEKAKKFESEKNKLTFDMEIEQIYLVGDFSVKTEGVFEELERNACRYKGDFIIAKPKEKIVLQNIERQGFPFFTGEITLKKQFSANNTNMMLDFFKCGINMNK